MGSETHCSKIDEFSGIHANGATEVSRVVSVIIVNNNTGSPQIVMTKSWGKRALYNCRISEKKNGFLSLLLYTFGILTKEGFPASLVL